MDKHIFHAFYSAEASEIFGYFVSPSVETGQDVSYTFVTKNSDPDPFYTWPDTVYVGLVDQAVGIRSEGRKWNVGTEI